MELKGVKIIGTGSYLPERVLTNAELESLVDTSDEWIRTRTGICQRHIAADDQPTSALAEQAAIRAMEAAGIGPEDIDLIVFATFTPDQPFPNSGCLLQARIGALNAACFSLEAACSGFIYAMDVAGSMIRAGGYKRALVVGAEKMSSAVDWQDRSTCVLFGDAAGAFVLESCPAADDNFISSMIRSDGRYSDLLETPGGGSAKPFSKQVLEERSHYLQMNGQAIFKLAVNNMIKACKKVLKDAGITIEQVKWLVPHQANKRIIDAIAKRLGVTEENCYINLNRTGNTSAATIPVAVDEIVQAGGLEAGDYLLMVAFGGGLTWGASLVRWS